jgi:hypothetical protein
MRRKNDRLLNDLPAYLEFGVLYQVRALRKVAPDHVLVKAVEQALEDSKEDPNAPQQLELPGFL